MGEAGGGEGVAKRSDLILRSRALARRLEGWCHGLSWFETAQGRLLTMRDQRRAWLEPANSLSPEAKNLAKL